ncbi:hypothetical protein LWI28_023528 [Acer negundo]|uniref:pectinesterase n=1 Tax=Acer negundo TaxID=4023 RepID=A0AAD5IS36_ACENE|nr:hypothetical protein LWI28_023528 [Acer negundo]
MPYPRVVFAYTSMTDVVLPVAWDENARPERRQCQRAFGTRKATLDPELVAAEANPQVIIVSQDGTGAFGTRKATLDPELVAAEGNPQVITVRQDGKGDFKKTNDAIKSIPLGNTRRVIIWIALQYRTVDSATVIVQSDYFVAANIIFKNSAPRPDSTKSGGQALALRISGMKAAFYKYKMLGFQDTLCDDKGVTFLQGLLH